MPASRAQELAVAGLLTALYLALPTRNPTGDAWYYAACARWGHELAQPHHLLYNGVGWLWLRLVGATGPAPAGLAALPWLLALTALAAGGCLLALGPLLRRAGARPETVPAWLLAVGSSFGMLRFATDNEAYVQPLLMALLASLAWARATLVPAVGAALPSRRWLVLAGGLAALACLLHQVMVWWWLGLLLGLRPWHGRANTGAVAAYVVPALLVPAAYALVAPGGVASALPFALHDYLSGGAQVALGWRSLLLTPISLGRTVMQVHGSLLPLWQRWPVLLGTAAIGSLALAGYAALSRQATGRVLLLRHLPNASAQNLRHAHLGIAGLHVAFAAVSAGNAEFMVMLPALAAVVLAGGACRAWPVRRVAALGAALLSWNLAFGLLPAHYLIYTDAGPALWAQVQRRPHTWFLLLDPNPVRNQLHYYTGQPTAPPRVLGLPGRDAAHLRAWLTQRLAAGDTVLTDALGGPQLLDRAHLLQGDVAAQALSGYATQRLVTLPTSFGNSYLVKLSLPANAPRRLTQPNTSASATVKTGAAK